MKILLINGENRENGAGRALLLRAEELLRETGAETELFWPVKEQGLLCSGCGACRGAGACVADRRPPALVGAAKRCDAFFLVSRASAFGLSVDVKNCLTRAAQIAGKSAPGAFRGKRAAAILLGAGRCRTAREQAADGFRACGLTQAGETALLRPADCEPLSEEAEETLRVILGALAGA